MDLRLALIAIGLLSSCGGSRDDAERKARAAREVAEAKARQHETGLAARVAQAKRATVALTDRVMDELPLARASELARQAKAELDKIYESNTDYDLDITTAAASSAHAAKLAAMPHVEVGDVTVGYEEVAGVSVRGTSSQRHFRATWRTGGRDVIVGYRTESRLDLAAFAALLPRLVPIVERLL